MRKPERRPVHANSFSLSIDDTAGGRRFLELLADFDLKALTTL